jgi:hypothetical protein
MKMNRQNQMIEWIQSEAKIEHEVTSTQME